MNLPAPISAAPRHAPAAGPGPGSASRDWRDRIAKALPLLIAVGFVAVFAVILRDSIVPSVVVDLVPAPAMAAEVTSAADQDDAGPTAAADLDKPPVATGAMEFQATGWIEPDPLPVRATALTDGVIEQVLVLEGEDVKQGQLLATLIRVDRELEARNARLDLERLHDELQAHCTDTVIEMHEIEKAKAMLRAAKADEDLSKDNLERLERINPRAINAADLIAARLHLQNRTALIEVAESQIQLISQRITRIAYQAAAMDKEISQAELALATAELALERTEIRAPISGRVLRLEAAPGQKKMLAMEDLDSATVAILYDPSRLQVRVDVPLADAARLGVGQPTTVHTNLLPDLEFAGVVTRVNGEADVQRNTLQAKVRILDPDPRLRPEMLSRVAFFAIGGNASASAGNPTAATSPLDVYIPESALVDGSVWVCDPETMRARRRPVTTGKLSRDGFLQLTSGLRPGEWLIHPVPENLADGDRVKARHPVQ